MTRRKQSEPENLLGEGVSLDSILSDGSGDDQPIYTGVDGVRLVNLVAVVAGLGGMVSCWYDAPNYRLCFSLRLGPERKSYQCETAEIYNQTLEAVTQKLLPVLGRKGKPNPVVRAVK